MAPALIRTFIAHLSPRASEPTALGPLAARSLLLARDETKEYGGNPHNGVIAPADINNTGMFVLFGLLGAAFVVAGIWFFFWAKNGGFYFKETDWDDYKTTVLRRRGPNGTLLSGATPSTNLGGGSIYKDIDDATTTTGTEDAPTVITATTEMTGITGGVSDFNGREKRRQKRVQKERDKERRREEKAREKADKKARKASKRQVNEEGVLVDEEAEAQAKAQLRNYRHEKAARVGGINKQSDSSAWDGSTNPSNSTAAESTVTSELMANRERTPTSTPTKSGQSGGIRKVYSAADRNEKRESDRIKAEARRLQEKGRAATGRRDFSFQRADDSGPHRINEATSSRGDAESRVPGSWTESEVGSEVGTKSYRHVIPGLPSTSSGTATNDFAYQDEKRRKRGGAGYRRGRGEMSEDGH